MQSPKRDKLKHKIRLQYQATNNEVEYEALLKGLELVKSVGAKSILILGDSQLIMGQINGTYEAKEGQMKKYLEKMSRLVKKFKEADFVQIPREENMEADTLAKEASATRTTDKFDEVQYIPSIDLLEMQQIENEENWITPIVSYLKDDEARKLRLERLGISLWTKFCTRKAFLNLISGVWLQMRRTMCYRKFMKEPVEIIRELDHSSTRSFMQDIIGQLFKQM